MFLPIPLPNYPNSFGRQAHGTLIIATYAVRFYSLRMYYGRVFKQCTMTEQ